MPTTIIIQFDITDRVFPAFYEFFRVRARKIKNIYLKVSFFS